ncbi:hypothetical protein [Acinetobacter pollinis]|uniref:Uncharacterized protein n=2 Tax=Acinetobacter TaxID=469 RepID=A0ABU6DVM5_9GAMM|nr:hypothetical protein [Acinetobacter pollinis]MBF7694140.1 hypothetical protein [Acinetobacter pollinis]MBF7699099.1 hypothetical protein [Acinetobacter pollinis]MBF7701704.1 hypothetical protein [Acinetobacter pollinis]MEB5477912.1 hypothetical protein [Acinetobacter pollinis]
MNKIKQTFILSAFLMPTLALATTTANTEPFTTSVSNVKAALGPQQAEVSSKGNSLTIISPRTGISYTLGNTEGRSIILQTDAIAAANSTNADRIIAVNPAISTESQEKAAKVLADMP